MPASFSRLRIQPRFGAEPVILVKAGESDFRAFSATCTHLDCIVTCRKDKGDIYCNCHGGTYDLTGRNVAGPQQKVDRR